MSKRRCVAVAVAVALPDDVWQCIMDQVELDDVTTVLNLMGTCHATGRMLWPRLSAWLVEWCNIFNRLTGSEGALMRAVAHFWDGRRDHARFWDTVYLYAQRAELVLAPVSTLLYVSHLAQLSMRLIYNPVDTAGKSRICTRDRSMLHAPLSEVYCYHEEKVTPVLQMDGFRIMEMGVVVDAHDERDLHMTRLITRDRASIGTAGVPDCALRALLLMNTELEYPGSFADFMRGRTVTYREPRPTDLVCDLVTLVAQREGPRRYEPVWFGKYTLWWRYIYWYRGSGGTLEEATQALPLFVKHEALRKAEGKRVKALYKNGTLF